jgi:Spy/CpxP family protein refolding chaperone
MKKLFAALIAAMFAGVTFSAIAADAAAPATPGDKPAMEKKHKAKKDHHKASKKEEAAPAPSPAK